MDLTVERIIVAVTWLLVIGVVGKMYRVFKRDSLTTWLRQLHRDATRAEKDEPFRKEQRALTEKAYNDLRPYAPVAPVMARRETFNHVVPFLVFATGGIGLIACAVHISQRLTGSEPGSFAKYGPFMLLISLLIMALSKRMRQGYSYIQQLNRLFLLQKQDDPSLALPLLEEILAYYPKMPALWLEKGDILARMGKFTEAAAAAEEALELQPNNADYTILRCSYLLRSGAGDKAKTVIDTLPSLRTAASDPRPELYAAAWEFAYGTDATGRKLHAKAIELDKDFTNNLIANDPSLKELQR